MTSGSDSNVDNFAMENLTAPYIITRDPVNWVAAPTDAVSNTVLGYQPTENDADIWAGLGGMLGLSGMRTFERIKGKA